MKNLFLIIVLVLMLFSPAFAVKVEVEALSDFSSDSPLKIYKVSG